MTGLDVGGNWLQVSAPSGYTVSQPLINYPISGPILSAPHMTPYECRTKQSGLGDPTDANCSAGEVREYFYKSTGPDDGHGPGCDAVQAAGQPKGARPSDVATATTIDGRSVPYIVRVESGVINRSIYRIAVLDDPSTDAVADGWNGRLGVTSAAAAARSTTRGPTRRTRSCRTSICRAGLPMRTRQSW